MSSKTQTPRFDILETPDGYTLEGEYPGIKREDVFIHFPKPSTIVIQGYVKPKDPFEGYEGRGWWVSERVTGKSYRAFIFPMEIDVERTVVKLADGILSIQVMKHDTGREKEWCAKWEMVR
ncbi:HSP20-like chaperone [Aspergillus sclerotioniger CBS 115572]|uniref:HSP20-like chaperone n=1 Tax=Aspergillus sclerotioniger CBS 115572 TaxID=1450535 RepID=A0A317VJS9_9EURO|nr:HSP20-like chaperone [Aspergillus sclerotioniger CBS 115572]PWY72160.1 HSP20-like chaperone [Aspergillus sclerotioniger CBS 115572]